MTARCSSCERPIVWAVTEATGKAMPLDADESGALAVVTGGSIVLTGRTDPRGAPIVAVQRGGGSARSHFATCPRAKEHRR